MFTETWKSFFEKYPKIKETTDGGQSQFTKYANYFVPQEYLDDPDWNDKIFADAVSYRRNYWGGQVYSTRYAVGGMEYTIAMNKD